MTHEAAEAVGLTIDEKEWVDPDVMPPTDLPYDDGDKLESPWHYKNGTLLLASYAATRGGDMSTSFAGANMFIYFSIEQARNRDYRGPDVFMVKDVDGTRERLSWIVWDENGRYPDIIFELLSRSTEKEDLTTKKDLYAQTFRTPEYFCVAPDVERLYGWRLHPGSREYAPIEPNAQGWLWSEQIGVWVGAWQGTFLFDERTWLRFYDEAGNLVLVAEEAEHQRAEAEHQRAEAEHQRAEAERQRAEAAEQRSKELADQLAAMQAELERLRGQGG